MRAMLFITAIPTSKKPPLPPRSPNKSPAPAALHARPSANLVLASVDESVSRATWRGGRPPLWADAARSTGLAAGTARNVVLPYVDVREFGRKALVKRAGSEFVKRRAAARGKAA